MKYDEFFVKKKPTYGIVGWKKYGNKTIYYIQPLILQTGIPWIWTKILKNKMKNRIILSTKKSEF